MDEEYTQNLLKFVASSQYCIMQFEASKALYQKSYYQLGVGEKIAVESLVNQHLGANYGALTAEVLNTMKSRKESKVEGFQVPQPSPEAQPPSALDP